MRTLPGRTGWVVALVVACTLTLFAAAVVGIAGVREAKLLEARKMAWRDSVAGVVFGFERQFTRFRGELSTALASRPARMEPASLHYEILVSRIELLAHSSNLDTLRDVPEYGVLMAKLQVLVATGDRVMAAPTPAAGELRLLLGQIDALAPDVQAYTTAATAATAQLLSTQFTLLSRRANAIAVLAALQMLLLGLAAYAIWTHSRRQAAARVELERLADELREATRAADAANSTKTQFLANMSHELRTPFQGVIGMLQLLEQSRPTAAQSDLIRTARESAQHLLTLLNDVLDLSAIESGRITLEAAPLDLHGLCCDVLSLMSGQAAARGLKLVSHIDPAVPGWVLGDATRIKQILFNLLGNAIKFTPSGQVTLAVSAGPASGSGSELVLSVIDTGIGMDPSTLDRLFQRFEMGDATLSRRFGGAGLGLEISRTLARMMGGDLTVASEPGKGSRFEMRVRLLECQPPAGQALPEPPPPAARRSLQVLVADDHPVNRKFLSLVLDSLGHRAVACENGKQAFEQVQAARFDAVLMDVHMPEMDGLEATVAIRALGGRFAALPILVLTADVLGGTREKALHCGVTDFLLKPLQAGQLADALDAAVGHEPAQPAAAPLLERFDEFSQGVPGAQLPQLLDMFFGDASQTISGLSAALAAGEAGAMGEAAHKLKGSARMLGFGRIAAVADEILQAASRGTGGRPLPTLNAELLAAIGETRSEVAARLGPAQAPA